MLEPKARRRARRSLRAPPNSGMAGDFVHYVHPTLSFYRDLFRSKSEGHTLEPTRKWTRLVSSRLPTHAPLHSKLPINGLHCKPASTTHRVSKNKEGTRQSGTTLGPQDSFAASPWRHAARLRPLLGGRVPFLATGLAFQLSAFQTSTNEARTRELSLRHAGVAAALLSLLWFRAARSLARSLELELAPSCPRLLSRSSPGPHRLLWLARSS